MHVFHRWEMNNETDGWRVLKCRVCGKVKYFQKIVGGYIPKPPVLPVKESEWKLPATDTCIEMPDVKPPRPENTSGNVPKTTLKIPRPQPAIYYLCDKRKCDHCHSYCKYTADIMHAKNYKRNAGMFMEKERQEIMEPNDGQSPEYQVLSMPVSDIMREGTTQLGECLRVVGESVIDKDIPIRKAWDVAALPEIIQHDCKCGCDVAHLDMPMYRCNKCNEPVVLLLVGSTAGQLTGE